MERKSSDRAGRPCICCSFEETDRNDPFSKYIVADPFKEHGVEEEDPEEQPFFDEEHEKEAVGDEPKEMIVTYTMAEIYAAQNMVREAIEIYNELIKTTDVDEERQKYVRRKNQLLSRLSPGMK
jgi:hypothetical protein